MTIQPPTHPRRASRFLTSVLNGLLRAYDHPAMQIMAGRWPRTRPSASPYAQFDAPARRVSGEHVNRVPGTVNGALE